MPHGALTQLGKQLRSVLVGTRSPPKISQSLTPWLIASKSSTRRQFIAHGNSGNPRHDTRRTIHDSPTHRHGSTAMETEEIEASRVIESLMAKPSLSETVGDATGALNAQNGIEFDISTSHEDSIQNGRGDAVARALLELGRESVIPRQAGHRRLYRRNGSRHDDYGKTSSLMLIIAKYLKYKATLDRAEQHQSVPQFELEAADATFLHEFNEDINDVREYAEMISAEDSYIAASLVARRIQAKGAHSLPYSVLSYVLRRPYIGAPALKILVEQCHSILGQDESSAGKVWNRSTIFVTFKLLVRHAREVWPQAFTTITSILLDFLKCLDRDSQPPSFKDIDKTTQRLNAAMRLLALPTAVEPFKEGAVQHASLVQILSYMAEHQPQLQINRDGYQAVTLVQLAHKKTHQDQQWAKLKALSWPPWKEARTAMDSDISVEEHGTSKAARTLQNMRAAGYSSGQWEKTALIYAGWDTDGTPTIQTRSMPQPRGRRFEDGTAMWSARISATRTFQEAWACYLAYENTHGKPSHDILLVVFQKLHRERRRQSQALHHLGNAGQGFPKLYPGDSKEVAPLPPSTHQYTYTRITPPTTLEEFYEHLRGRGIILNDRCLAFLIANAPTRSAGMRYISDSLRRYPALQALTTGRYGVEINRIPDVVFAAVVQLLVRFTRVPLNFHGASEGDLKNSSNMLLQCHDNTTKTLNLWHGLSFAMKLLEFRRSTFLPPWNSVMTSLGKHTPGFIRNALRQHDPKDRKSLADGLEWNYGTIIAYEFAQKLIDTMKTKYLDLDPVGLQAFCICTENAIFGAWMLLREDESRSKQITQDDLSDNSWKSYARYGTSFVGHLRDSQQLKTEFWRFVGDQPPRERIASEDVNLDSATMPHLLGVPSPALLHAYVRALGWLGDYDGLRDTVQWMTRNATTLAEKQSRDRNGKAVMRRTIVGLRVFLERSWLSNTSLTKSTQIDRAVRNEMQSLEAQAPLDAQEDIRLLVQNEDIWGGWPTDGEVEEYCEHPRFRQFA